MLRSKWRAVRLARSFSTVKKELPEVADAIVIGGGSIGASTCYHLAARGLKTVLLEAHSLTAGTTWHTAGMLWRLRPSYVDVELHTVTRARCIELEEEMAKLMGSDASATKGSIWNENGGLFIACNRERLAEYVRLANMGQFYGIYSTVLSPKEARDVHPLIAIDDVYGALHSPTDGTIDPAVVDAYCRVATAKFGAVVLEGARVASIETEAVPSFGSGSVDRGQRRITGVTLGDGRRVRAPIVVNAAGAWANSVARMAGCATQLPLLALKHAYVVTEKIEGMHGKLPNVRDHDLSIYLKAQGTALAIGGYEQNPEFWPAPSREFAFSLFDLDWDTFAQNLAGHIKRCPAVETAGIKSTVCGPESFTPDHKPLVGPQDPSTGPRGLFHACGFNSMGMMLGGGIGQEIATWVIEGSAALDLFSFDIARFHPSAVRDAAWVKRTTHESYAKTYSIVFPHDEPLAGRGMLKSALHDELLRNGCVHQARHSHERPGWFVDGTGEQAPLPYDYYGAYAEKGTAWRLAWGERDPDSVHGESQPLGAAPELGALSANNAVEAHPAGKHAYHKLLEGECTFDWPASFPNIARECEATRHGVGLYDQSYFGKFILRGAGAEAAARWLFGANVTAKPFGTVTYTPLCNARGGTEADLTVTRRRDGTLYVVGAGATVTKDKVWIESELRRALPQARACIAHSWPSCRVRSHVE